MGRSRNPIAVVLSVYRYKRHEYSLLYVALMLCTVLEVVKFGESFGLTDVIYAFFALLFGLKTIGVKGKTSERIHTQNKYTYYLYPVLFLVIAIIGYYSFGATRMLQSQFRFVFNCLIFVIIYTYFHISSSRDREKLISSYIYVCVICSTFVIIQFLSFYLFHYNIKFDIGENNAASLETFAVGVNYRTGGLFNEPSWFTLFVGPVLDMAYRLKKFKELFVCIVGLILSTSSMAFLFLFLFAMFKLRGNNKKYIIILALVVVAIYFVFPIAFDRFFNALSNEEGTNSNNARVILPMTVAFAHSIPLFGLDIGDLYAVNENLFLNTFVFVILAFGIVGLIIFLHMILNRKHVLLSLILLLIVIIEGCYGRIDFWMTLLAASVFCDNTNYEHQMKYKKNDYKVLINQ